MKMGQLFVNSFTLRYCSLKLILSLYKQSQHLFKAKQGIVSFPQAGGLLNFLVLLKKTDRHFSHHQKYGSAHLSFGLGNVLIGEVPIGTCPIGICRRRTSNRLISNRHISLNQDYVPEIELLLPKSWLKFGEKWRFWCKMWQNVAILGQCLAKKWRIWCPNLHKYSAKSGDFGAKVGSLKKIKLETLNKTKMKVKCRTGLGSAGSAGGSEGTPRGQRRGQRRGHQIRPLIEAGLCLHQEISRSP